MIWHVIKRELYDNLNSLRFALTTILFLGLMIINAVGHLREQPKRIQAYNEAVNESLTLLNSHADDSLYKLAQQGPGILYKKTVNPAVLRSGRRTPIAKYRGRRQSVCVL